MSKWQQVKLGDIASNIQTGPFGSQLHQSDYSEIGTPVVMPKDLVDGKISEQSIARVEPSHVKRLAKHKIQNGDILYSRRGDVGRCAYAGKEESGWLCGTGCLRVTIDESHAFPKFIFYQLQTSQSVGWVEKHAVGSTMLNLNTSILSNVPVSLPPIEVQRKIADVLSAYDDLIENNRKQIKLLEEAAQRLYKEWFIDLRFPGHETTPIIDGIPEGWERKTVEEFLNFHANGGWGKETSMGKCVNIGKVIRGTDIDPIKQSGNVDNIPIRYHSELDIKNKKLLPNDIVFELSNGNLNNIGRSLLINTPLLEQCGMDTICASFCKLLRAKNRFHAILLFMEIQDMQSSGRMLPFKKHGANGINNFDFESFLSHSLLYSNNADLLCHIDAIIQKIDILRLNIKNAIESRDHLLPKLMTAELEVER